MLLNLNAQLAQALDAKVIIVSNADINKPSATAEKVDSQLRYFGGASSERTAGVLLMRTKGLPDDSAHIPVTFDPSLRLISDTNKFIIELQKTHPKTRFRKTPCDWLGAISVTRLSVPRMSDLAAHISADMD